MQQCALLPIADNEIKVLNFYENRFGFYCLGDAFKCLLNFHSLYGCSK